MSAPVGRSGSAAAVHTPQTNPADQSIRQLIGTMWAQRQAGVGATLEQHHALAGRVTDVITCAWLFRTVDSGVTRVLTQLDQNWSARSNRREELFDGTPRGVWDLTHIDAEKKCTTEVPIAYHNKEPFKDLLCPISHCPIRFVVTVKKGGSRTHDFHFEHQGLLDMIAVMGEDRLEIPQSRQKFTKADIVRNLDLQDLIDTALIAALTDTVSTTN